MNAHVSSFSVSVIQLSIDCLMTILVIFCSVQHRWERVVARSAERTRALDHGYKEAREFHDAWYESVDLL